jgi:tetratricopeptide (TPR) repeat protein
LGEAFADRSATGPAARAGRSRPSGPACPFAHPAAAGRPDLSAARQTTASGRRAAGRLGAAAETRIRGGPAAHLAAAAQAISGIGLAAWAPAAGPPAASEAPAHRPDREAVAVAHGLATRADADHAVRVGDRDQQLDNLDQAAREALLAGDAATALSLYERLTREFPEARAARLGQALALEQLGRSDEARVMYQALLQLDPGDLGTKIALLGILAERAPDEALQLLRRLARHHPDDPRLAAQIAMVLARTGDLAAAIVAGRRAVALDPGHAGYRANLAILLDRAGQRSAAIEQYQRVLELATLGGAPTARLGAIAARLHHLRQAPPPPPAEPSR